MPQRDSVDIFALSDLCTPWCVHVVATLRIADQMAAGITRIDDLAEASDCNAAALLRVLTHLVGKGVFEEPAPGRFAMNEPARALIDGPLRLGLDLDSFGGRMAHAWSSLLGAVRTGAPAYHEVFGRPFWEDLQAHPDIAASFDALMGPAGHGTPDPELQITGGWESVRSVVDVGGGTGAFLAGILNVHPTVRGTLVDLPPTVARSGEIFQAAGVADRVTTVGQSFFHPLPAGADLYLLKCAERLAGSRGAGDSHALRRGGASRRSRHRPQRSVARRERPAIAFRSDHGVGRREGAKPGGVSRPGSRGRVGRAGRRTAALGPLYRRVPRQP